MLISRIKFYLFVDALKGEGEITIFFSEQEGISFSTDSICLKFGSLFDNAESFTVPKADFLEALDAYKKSDLPKLLELSVVESSISPPRLKISDVLTIDLEYSEKLWEELDISIDVDNLTLVPVNQGNLKKLDKVNSLINYVGDVFYANAKDDSYALYGDGSVIDNMNLFAESGSFEQPEIIALMNLIDKKGGIHAYRYANNCLLRSEDEVTFYFKFIITHRTAEDLNLNDYASLPSSECTFHTLHGLDVVQYIRDDKPVYISKELYNKAVALISEPLVVGVLGNNLVFSHNGFTTVVFIAPMLKEEIPDE
jgi:hypothetical protein